MTTVSWNRGGLLAGLATVGLLLTGCGEGNAPTEIASAPDASTVAIDDGGWWCAEHGVPEEECARCDSSLVDGFKEKGDWCEEHDRPESQCFLCSPARFERFAARYEAKFGQKPPQPEE